MSQEQYTSLPSSSGPQESDHTVRDSRKGKDVMNDLTTNMDGMALNRGMALEHLNHYVGHISLMAHEKQLEAICEEKGSKVGIRRLMYQMC